MARQEQEQTGNGRDYPVIAIPDGHLSAPDTDGDPRTLSDIFSALVDRLESDAEERVSRRLIVEERWLQDLRQFEGSDDHEIVAELRKAGRSTAVVNVTRSKCNTFVSKVYDMLFPTDEKNWGIKPTPVPEMDAERKRLAGVVPQMTEMADTEEDDAVSAELEAQADEMAQALAKLEAEQQDAAERCELMEKEIEDNLVECEYAVHNRNLIDEAVHMGTGVLKGPLPLNERVRKNWQRMDGGQYRMRYKSDHDGRFYFEYVSCWNIFPDNSTRQFGQTRSWMERHIMRDRDLIDFARTPGVDEDAVRRLLRDGPQGSLPNYLVEIDTTTEEEQRGYENDYFVVWEYRGPLEEEEMQALLMMLAGDGDKDTEFSGMEELDPLTQVDAVVWFCQGEIIKMGVSHMDDNAPVYSVFQIEKSISRLWNVGIPYLMRTQQNILSDAWRRMQDNAAFAGFPITEMDLNVVQRAGGGTNVLAPGSIWERTGQSDDRPGFIFHDIPIHQEHYQNIIQLALQFMDMETNLSVIASGEQGAHTTHTAGGMALLMNNVNVVFRRVIKNFDDDITMTAIRRAYDFLMQFSPKDDIKGDYTVDARGSSVLLVREIQAQNLLILAMQISVHPLLGKHIRVRNLMKKLCQSMMVSSDELLKTEEEVERSDAEEAQAQAEAPPDPAMVALQLERELAQMDAELKMQLAQMDAQSEQGKLLMQHQMSMEQIMGRIAQIREQNTGRERILAGEAGIEARKPPGTGSGGFLSGG